MPERKGEEHLSPIQKAEVYFLNVAEDRGGLTITEALQLQEEDPKFYLGTGIDAIDVINKFLSLGFLEYQSQTGKFIPVKFEENALQSA